MRLVFLLFLAVFVGCAPARLDRSSLSNADVIAAFVPDRGERGIYKLGEQVRFRLSLKKSGFIHLISYEPTNNVVIFERNVPIRAGEHVFPRPEDRQGNAQAAYLIVPPTGANRVIALYSDVPLEGLPRGTRDNNALQAGIRSALQTSKATSFDLAETEIEVK
ncbi:MAG: DUF4384 domain-containing protein [Deinococcales bacterium]